MQLLAFREPSGRVFIIDEIHALPPLAEGYEWTMVVQPDRDPPGSNIPDQPTATAVPAAATASPAKTPGIFDVALQLLTPRPGQTPEERGLELIAMLPADLRRDLTRLLRVFLPRTLPPFPQG